jgi:hypothetical protein
MQHKGSSHRHFFRNMVKIVHNIGPFGLLSFMLFYNNVLYQMVKYLFNNYIQY